MLGKASREEPQKSYWEGVVLFKSKIQKKKMTAGGGLHQDLS